MGVSARVAWRLGEDGRRHAILKAGAVRGLCRASVRAERFDRTDKPKCLDCVAAAGKLG